MNIYTYPETIQNMWLLFEEAFRTGEVKVRRNDGHIFVIRPEMQKHAASPLDVEGLDLGMTTAEILASIHEGRERSITKETASRPRSAITAD